MLAWGIMRRWVLELPVDRGVYRVDLRSRTYEYVGTNPNRLPAKENADQTAYSGRAERSRSSSGVG